MRKSIFVLALASIVTSASAQWQSEESAIVQAGNTHVIHFVPLKAGDHQVLLSKDVLSAFSSDSIEFCWGSFNDFGTWHCWADEPLTHPRYQQLYTGSDDIIFRITFKNKASKQIQFFWQFDIN